MLTAVSIFFVYKNVGLSLELIPALLLTILLVISVLTDIREQLILDIVTLPMLGLLIISRLFIGTEPFWYYLLGGAVGFLLLLLLAIVSKGGMGGGDIKLYAAIGVALGPAPNCHESRPCVLCWSNCWAFPNDNRKSKKRATNCLWSRYLSRNDNGLYLWY